MISADAGIWLAFLKNDPSVGEMRGLLGEQRVTVHPFVLLELRLRVRSTERKRIISDLEHLVACGMEPPEVVAKFVEEHDLARFQVDAVGAHLLASAARHGDELWTANRDLKSAAAELGVAFEPS